MGEVLPPRSGRTWRYWWQGGAWLDQGTTSQCVAYSFTHWLADGPITQPNLKADDAYARALYCAACKIDLWPANDGCDRQFGTSGRAAAEVLRRRGLIGSYWWARSLDDLVRAVLDIGPVCVGTDWTSGMFEPAPRHGNAYIGPTGPNVGGHQYVINGVNLEPREGPPFFRLKNSWGRGWGHRGTARIAVEDLASLVFERGGDACLALEVQKVRVPG